MIKATKLLAAEIDQMQVQPPYCHQRLKTKADRRRLNALRRRLSGPAGKGPSCFQAPGRPSLPGVQAL
jgi:hypothetical protein